jgi:hypothetical protein
MSSSLNEPSLRMQVVNLQTGAVSIEQVPMSKMVTAKKPVSLLTDSQVEQATQLYPQVGYVISRTLEQWIQGFTYDFHPEQEIQVWSVIGAAFEIYNKTHHLSLIQKRKVVRRLIQLVGGEELDDSLSLELLKILNQSQEVPTFVSRLSQPQQPWDKIDYQMLAEIYTEYVERHPGVIQDDKDELFVTLARLMEGNEPASELGKELQNIWDYLKKLESENGEFDSDNISDERQKRSRNVVDRPGQKKFRSDLMKAYGGCCAITDCPVESVLHAAHIIPFLGAKTDHPSNGLLLRVDIHKLFDSRHLGINPDTKKVEISPILRNTCYQGLSGQPLRLPKSKTERPNYKALLKRYQLFSGC